MIRVAVLGAGGLGKGLAAMLPHRTGFSLVAIADSSGYCYQADGLDSQQVCDHATMASLPSIGVSSTDSILALLREHGQDIDAIFMALPNLPVTFYADTVRMIAEKTPFQGVLIDAMKRTKAVELLMPLDGLLKERQLLYITGAGATPGFLTTVAAVAAQSFVEVLAVDIHFGVGIANWEQYKATIREDILHLPGFNAEIVSAMTDVQIEAELESRNGLLEMVNMEHADDIILELAGICPRDRVTVGGLVDTRNAKKPCSTTVSITGKTVAGAVTQHQFTVGDATTMVDNVCGPVLGFLRQGVDMHRQYGMTGLITSASIMPSFGPAIGEAAQLQTRCALKSMVGV
jgi:hypothetical protein